MQKTERWKHCANYNNVNTRLWIQAQHVVYTLSAAAWKAKGKVAYLQWRPFDLQSLKCASRQKKLSSGLDVFKPPTCMVETWPPVWRYWKWVESTTLRLGTDLSPEPHCLSLPWLSAPLGGLAHTPNSIVHDAVHHSRRQSPNRWGHPTLDFPPSKMWAEYTVF